MTRSVKLYCIVTVIFFVTVANKVSLDVNPEPLSPESRLNKMVLKLYKLDASPPARAVMMMCDKVGVPVEMIDVDLLKGEHVIPEFLKMNPLHTVPTLVDGDLVICDSHAALMYLADKYGKNDSIYPKEIAIRALVNQQLFVNNGILFTRMRNITYPIVMEGPQKITQKQKDDVFEAYGFVEEYLTRNKYLATNDMTIADIAAFATLSSTQYLIPLEDKFPKIKAWLTKMQNEPFAKKSNAPGLAIYIKMIAEKVLP